MKVWVIVIMIIKELVESGFRKKYLISDEQKQYLEAGDLISKLHYEKEFENVKVTMYLYIFYDNSENSECVTHIYVENKTTKERYSEEYHIELNYDNILNYDFDMFDNYLI